MGIQLVVLKTKNSRERIPDTDEPEYSQIGTPSVFLMI